MLLIWVSWAFSVYANSTHKVALYWNLSQIAAVCFLDSQTPLKLHIAEFCQNDRVSVPEWNVFNLNRFYSLWSGNYEENWTQKRLGEEKVSKRGREIYFGVFWTVISTYICFLPGAGHWQRRHTLHRRTEKEEASPKRTMLPWRWGIGACVVQN